MLTNKVQVFNVPILGLLGLLFVYLKLTGNIGWSWWYVTLPFWGPVAVIFGFAGILFTVAIIASLGKATWR